VPNIVKLLSNCGGRANCPTMMSTLADAWGVVKVRALGLKGSFLVVGGPFWCRLFSASDTKITTGAGNLRVSREWSAKTSI
jgi:hypothetical protein